MKPLFDRVYLIYTSIALVLFFILLKGVIENSSANQSFVHAVLFLLYLITSYILIWVPWVKAIQGFWRTPYWLHPVDLQYIRLFPVSVNKFLRIDQIIRYLWFCGFDVFLAILWFHALRIFHVFPSIVQMICCSSCWVISRIGADFIGQLNFKRAFQFQSILYRLMFVVSLGIGSVISFRVIVFPHDIQKSVILTGVSVICSTGAIWLLNGNVTSKDSEFWSRVMSDASQKQAKLLSRVFQVDMRGTKPIRKWRKRIPLPEGSWNFGWRYIRLIIRVPGYFKPQIWLFAIILAMSIRVSSGHAVVPASNMNSLSMSSTIGLLLAFIAGVLVSSIMYAKNWNGDVLTAPWLPLFPLEGKVLIHQLQKGPTVFSGFQGVLYWGIAAVFLYPAFGSDWMDVAAVIVLGAAVSLLLARIVVRETVSFVQNPKRMVSPIVIACVVWGYVALIATHDEWLDTLVSWLLFLGFAEVVQVLGRFPIGKLYRKFLNNL